MRIFVLDIICVVIAGISFYITGKEGPSVLYTTVGVLCSLSVVFSSFCRYIEGKRR